MKKIILTLVLSCSLPGLAMAQAYPQPSPEAASTQDQLDHLHDHLEHDRQHQQIEDAHAREHASGFTSEAQHQEYHRQLDNLHGDVHDALPGTEHAHDDAAYNNRSSDGSRQGYQNDRGYGDRGYANQYVEHRTVTRYARRPARYSRYHHHHTTSYSHNG